jgi:DNA-binding transcriptional LysR family regulator
MPIFTQYDRDVDLEALNERRIEDLIDREPDIAVRLEACRHEEPHENLVCAVCSEASRIPYID